MIRFKATGTNGRTYVFLGIEKPNVARLMEGRPIQVMGEELDIATDIIIAYGATKQNIIDELKEAGFPAEVLDLAMAGYEARHGEESTSQ